MSFQKVVKLYTLVVRIYLGFRTVSFQKVVKLTTLTFSSNSCFRTVSFQKVVKLSFVFMVLCQLGGSKSNSKHYEIRN